MLKLPISTVKQQLIVSLINKGMKKHDAEIVAEDYLMGELQGKVSHGLMAFPSLLNTYTSSTKQPEIIKKTHALIVIEANGQLGAIIGKHASDLLFEMVKKEGIGIAFIKNMTTWLHPDSIAEYIANNGFVGIVMNNGGRPMVAPPGGYDPVIGTNPIGIGIPTEHLNAAHWRHKVFGRRVANLFHLPGGEAITYQNPKKNLTDEEVAPIRNKLIELALKKFGLTLKSGVK